MNAFSHLHTLLGPHRQHDRLLRLHTPLGPDALLAERVYIDEHIGPMAPPAAGRDTPEGAWAVAGMRLEILALAADTHLELKTLIGQSVLLELLTAHSRSVLRPWHGHVTEAALLGSDGGLARYRLVVEPWLAFLAHRQDSWVFQGRRVPEIVDEVFADHQGQGRLAPAWRWDLADPEAYPQRSLCIQYQESDLAFVRRLLREEGLFAWWEHAGDATSATLGAHTLVIADHPEALAPNPQPRVRYTQSGQALREDSLTRWQRSRRVRTATLTLASRDHRSLSLRETAEIGRETALCELGLHDVPGAYAYEDAEQGERLARVQMEALDAQREQVVARGSWRTAAPGTLFTLTDHPVHDGRDETRDRFATLQVQHRARNNLSADEAAQVNRLLGPPERRQGAGPANAGDEPEYECTVTAQPARLPVRPSGLDEHGLPDVRLHPRPTITGVQTALVVGLGEPVHTERDHRIKVQFHWQRGDQASHRLAHPAGDNAPAADHAFTWVRVAERVAGANWGAHFVPRLGQEVLVGFIGGDIDRPVVLGALYNGVGLPDAQGNQVGGGAARAVGAAAAWFPGGQAQGRLQAHQHTQVHTGFKTQALASSQQGLGGHNQLVLDDTPGQQRIELFSSTAQTRLQLGHLLHQLDNRRLQHRGHGADLATAAWGAVRAGAGTLISAHGRAPSVQASGQIDAREPIQQLTEAHQLVHTLAESAQRHHARAPREPDIAGTVPAGTGDVDTAQPDPQRPPPPEHQLPTERGLLATLDSLKATDSRGDASAGPDTNADAAEPAAADRDPSAAIGGGAGTVPAWGRPDLVAAAPAGIAAFTPAHATWAAAGTVTLVAGQDLQAIAQRHLACAVNDALVLYTYGKAHSPDKPNQETGIALHAATGNVQTQSQTAATRLAADARVHIASTTGKVTLAAPKHILLAANGAAIRMHDGNITCIGPGSVLYKASLKVFNSPGARVPYGFQALPDPDAIYDERFRLVDTEDRPLAFQSYRIVAADGQIWHGVTDADGLTLRIYTSSPMDVSVEVMRIRTSAREIE